MSILKYDWLNDIMVVSILPIRILPQNTLSTPLEDFQRRREIFPGVSPDYACRIILEVYPKIKFCNFRTHVEGFYSITTNFDRNIFQTFYQFNLQDWWLLLWFTPKLVEAIGSSREKVTPIFKTGKYWWQMLLPFSFGFQSREA